jgi:acetyltransferase-like isoleucine patch superfamily enzyme
MVLSAQPLIIWFWLYWRIFSVNDVLFYIFFPVWFIVGLFVFILSSIIVARFFLSFANLSHKPHEGVFTRSSDDKDYCFWSLRAIIRKWPVWLIRQLSLPFFEILAYKILGIKTSFSSALDNAWIDCEFIEIGKNVRIGQGSLIMSNIIVSDKLIIKKVLIGDNVIIGAHVLILPGTVIGDNTIVDSNGLTLINQKLEGNSIYSGNPAKKYMTNNEIKKIEGIDSFSHIIDPEKDLEKAFLREEVKELSVPFHFYIITGFIIIAFSFVIPGILFFIVVFGLIVPYLFNTPLILTTFFNPNTYLIMISTPIFFIGLYLLHLFFVALFTRWFYKLADARGASQGIYDRNLDESSEALDYYHFRAFLMKYPVSAYSNSPFPWLLNWELRFIRSNKIGKNTVLEETFLHSHINFGKNCYLGTSSHITNHLVDGVYGSENLTFIGVSIDDNSVLNSITGGLPGTKIGKNSTLLPSCTTLKFDKLGSNGIYAGFPARKLTNEEVLKYIGGEYSGE